MSKFYTVKVKKLFFWKHYKVMSHFGEQNRLVLSLLNGSQLLLGNVFNRDIIFGKDFFDVENQQKQAAAERAQLRDEVRASVEAEVKAEAEEQRNQQLKAMMAAQPPPSEQQGIPKFATPQALRRN